MKPIDPERSWVELERRIGVERDPRCRSLLELVRDHMRAELRMQLQPVMATLADRPIYSFHGMPGYESLQGTAAVEAYYRQMFSEGRMGAEFQIARIVVDHATVVTEGTMISALVADEALAANIRDVKGEAVSVGSRYLARTPLLVVWPATAGGRLVGENIYLGSASYDDCPAHS